MRNRLVILVAAGLIGLFAMHTAPAGEPSIILQSTTSTANSGLYDHILPLFKAATTVR